MLNNLMYIYPTATEEKKRDFCKQFILFPQIFIGCPTMCQAWVYTLWV